MENNKPKTIDEFFIERYEKLEEENRDLQQQLSMRDDLEKVQDENIDFWKNKYYEIINKIKEDFEPTISTTKKGDVLIEFKHWTHFKEYSKLQYEFYKNLFNLKEEGEKENEQ